MMKVKDLSIFRDEIEEILGEIYDLKIEKRMSFNAVVIYKEYGVRLDALEELKEYFGLDVKIGIYYFSKGVKIVLQ